MCFVSFWEFAIFCYIFGDKIRSRKPKEGSKEGKYESKVFQESLGMEKMSKFYILVENLTALIRVTCMFNI